MKDKKILIFLPDGVGLRNFVFGAFSKIANEYNFSLEYWNNTKYPIKDKLGFNEKRIVGAKNHFYSDLLKRSKNIIELKQSYKKFKNPAYLSYIFKSKNTSIKTYIKNQIVKSIIYFNAKKNIEKLFIKIANYERQTKYYEQSLQKLKEYKPDFLFCTNQRPMLAVTPMLAAKDLNIPTAVFIFSWDNLPKGMLVVEADYYFVWSIHMKEELLKYYPHIKSSQIKITGSPQFEIHFDETNFMEKEEFFEQHKLDLTKKYILFSGDDITTSPYDHFYLEDLAKIIRERNKKNTTKLGIIYRKCPVDFTNRHVKIVDAYKNEITCIDPLWENLGNEWDTVMPLKEDFKLLTNTIKYSELVVNVGSSMVFDAVSNNKPCAYINYNTDKGDVSKWDIEKIYKYIHFKSMPSKDAVLWLNNKKDYKTVIDLVINNNYDLNTTEKWFKKINNYPKQSAQEIHKNIHNILNPTI